MTSLPNNVSPPRRFIFNDSDMSKFLDSPAKKQLLQVVQAMGKACESQLEYEYDPNTPLKSLTPAMAALLGSLRAMLSWIEDCPPFDRSKARFGNPAFRKWHERLVERSVSIVYTILKMHQEYPDTADYDLMILEQALQEGIQAAGTTRLIETIEDESDRVVVLELCAYLRDSFGHPMRLDYGTGHECSFQVLLYSLLKIGCFGSTPEEPPTQERLKAVTLSLWSGYLAVTRQLQTDYMLEPAGSHGVWGLDDYHCLPFYYGACQLEADCGDESVPNLIHRDSVLAKQGDRFLYYGCIRYIKSLKKGVPFFEHSPMLNDISNLPSWKQVASGLLKLFEGEVLKKRQVVQHFVFGNIFSANWTPSEVQKQAPTTTFRTEAVGPMARAPWADDPDGGRGGMPPPTRAPWAK